MTGPASLPVNFTLSSLPVGYFKPPASGASCEVMDVWANSSSTVAVGKAEGYSLRYRQALLLKVGGCK